MQAFGVMIDPMLINVHFKGVLIGSSIGIRNKDHILRLFFFFPQDKKKKNLIFLFKKQKTENSIPVVTQQLQDLMLSLRGCRFDPWPCSLG